MKDSPSSIAKKALLFIFVVTTTFLSFSQQTTLQNCIDAPKSIEVLKFQDDLTYAPGSNITVFINPVGVYEIDNQFKLFLVNTSTNTETLLSTKDEFYIPILNGMIPTDTSPGNYTLKIRAQSLSNLMDPPVEVSTNPFAVSADTITNSILSLPTSPTGVLSFQDFSKCLDYDSNNYNIGLLNSSSDYETGTSFSIIFDNFSPNANQATLYALTDNPATPALDYQLDAGTALTIGAQITVPQGISVGTYLIEFTKTVNGISMTYGVVFMVNTGNTSLGNLSSDRVCLDSDVVFTIDTDAIKNNYPGSKYSFDFGDGSPLIELTHNQILNCSEIVHIFTKVTCDAEEKVVNPSSDNNEYFFQVDFNLFNKYLLNNDVYNCDTFLSNGSGTTKWVNVNSAPVSDFIKPDKVCANSEIVAIENSTLPKYGLLEECSTDYVVKWEFFPPYYTDFEEVLSNTPGSVYEGWITVNPNSGQSILTVPGNFTSVPGCYTLRLTTNTISGCNEFSIIEKTIIVEPTPEPDFTYTPSTSLCAPVNIAFTNTSNTEDIDPVSCGNPSYTWSVEPVDGTPATSTGFTINDANTGDTISAENQTDVSIEFTQPGTYNVSLQLENICGTVIETKEIIIISDPTVSFSPDTQQICQEAPAGYTLDFSEASIAPTYSESPYTPTSYLWEVFESDGITAASNYSFVNGTSASTDYPQISVTEFGVYKIKVSVFGNCGGGGSDEFEFTLKQSPTVTNTNTNLTQQICSGEATEEVVLTSDMANTTYVWEASTSDPISGFPTGQQTTSSLPVMNLVNSCNETGAVTIQVIPTVDGCSGNPVDFIFTVDPTPQIEDKAPAAICSGEEFTIIPLNSCTLGGDIVPAGTSYTWSVTQITGTVTGVVSTDTGTGNVIGTITNTSASFGTVEYTVTPTSANGCEGDVFTVTMTVNPEPVVADQVHTACSDEALGINFNASSSVAAEIYNITALNLNGLTVSAGGAAIANGLLASDLSDDAFTNTSSAPVDVVYTVVPVSGAGCEGDAFTVTVTVNPEPVVADQTLVVCSDELLNYTLENDSDTPNVASYSLTNIDDNGLTPGSGNSTVQTGYANTAISSDTWNNTTPNAIDVVYTFVPVGDNGCQGDAFTLTVTVNPEPVVADQTLVVCSDELFNYTLENDSDTPNVVSYSLTNIVSNGLTPGSGNSAVQTGLPNTAISNDSWTNTTTTAVVVAYTFVPLADNGCEGDAFTVSVTVDPEPVVANQIHAVCSDEALGINFNASSSVAAETYNITALNLNGLTVTVTVKASPSQPAPETGTTV